MKNFGRPSTLAIFVFLIACLLSLGPKVAISETSDPMDTDNVFRHHDNDDDNDDNYRSRHRDHDGNDHDYDNRDSDRHHRSGQYRCEAMKTGTGVSSQRFVAFDSTQRGACKKAIFRCERAYPFAGQCQLSGGLII